jgi:hypothetical protein
MKTTMRYHFLATKLGVIKSQTMASVGEDVGTLEPVSTAARMYNGTATLENSLVVHHMTSHGFQYCKQQQKIHKPYALYISGIFYLIFSNYS